MLFRVARGVLVLIMSMAALAAHAVTYNISTTKDGAPVVDGECTIREAVQAATTQTDVGDCIAGTGSDRLILEPGQVYLLDSGQGEMAVGGSGINVNLRLLVPDPENDDPAILDMGGGSRAFTIASGSSLVLDAVSLRNGNASAGDGGLVHSSGRFEIRNRAVLENGTAARGGLVYGTGAVRVLSGARLTGGNAGGDGGAVFLHGVASLAVVDSRLDNNLASNNGGAVALQTNFEGGLVIQGSLLDDNEATNGNGGALFFRGDQVRFQLYNSSLLANRAPSGAGALYVGSVTSDQDIDINNITVADNFSGTGSVDILSADEFDSLLNSVIVGDRGAGDCDGALGNASGSNIVVEFSFLGRDPSTTDPNNPVSCRSTGEGVVTPVDMTILRGVDGAGDVGPCTGATTDVAVCDPLALDPYPGYLPGLVAANSPWNNANPQDQVAGSCLAQDQRGISRLENRCDAGALEFAVAVGEDDEFTVIQGRRVLLEIGDNDLGDGRIDCRRGAVAANPLAVVLPAHQSNEASGDTDLDNDGVDDGTEANPFDVDDCAQILKAPTRPGATVRFVEDPDQPGSILLEYVPGTSYHGLDELAYRVNRAAFEPTRNAGVYATRANRNVEAVVFIVSEPASGMQESETIAELGSMGGITLITLLLLGLVRRGGRTLTAIVLLLAASVAGAAEIQVTTLQDNFAPGDGFCSVREALYSSIDELVNLEGACNNGQGGQDTVVLPRGCIQLDPANGPLVVESSVELVGQGVHGVDAGNLPDGTECDDTSPNWTEGTILVGDQDQIIDAQAKLALRSLSLFDGQSADNGGALRSGAALTIEEVEFYNNSAANLGGAVYLAGVVGDSQDVRIENVYFLNNLAQVSGGAISLAGGVGYQLVIGDTTFEGNRAEQSGGAMLINSGGGYARFANVLATGNTAGSGSGGFDASEAQANVRILNTTIVNNTGGDNPGLDAGDADPNRSVNMTNSVYALNYVWNTPPGNPGDARTLNGDCSSDAGGGTQVLNVNRNNLFSSAVVIADECAGSDMGNNEQAADDETDVKSEFQTDGSGNLFTAPNVPADETTFIPPNLLVLNTSTWIKDKGNDGDLASGYDKVNLCRADDQRGLPRTSGLRCDRGAFEVQETTAIDDEADNKGSNRAAILIDILKNDSTDPSKRIVPESVSVSNLPTVPVSAGAVMVLRTDPDVACDPAEDGYDEGCVLRYDPEDTTPIADDDNRTPYGCINDGDTVEHTFTYNFQTDPAEATPSNDATVTVTLQNLAPRVKNKVLYNEPGGTVVFKVDVSDPFGYNGPVDMSTLSLGKEPLFAAEDEFGNVLGTGIKLNSPAPGYVTYVSGDTTKRFTDSFVIGVEDDCGTESTGGIITIRYDDEDASGGDLLAGGASLLPLGVLMLLGGFRRRRVSR